MARPKPTNPDDATMGFGEHLEELRRRIIYALYGLAVACCVSFYYCQDIVGWLVVPLAHAQRNAGLPVETIAVSVMTGFTLYMKIGVIAGLILSAPWIMYQAWKFVAAGLYVTEQRVVIFLAPFSAIMAALGVLFLYYIMLPLALMFLISFATTYPTPSTEKPLPIETMMGVMPNWTRDMMDWMNGTPPRQAPPSTTQPSATTQPVSLPVLSHDPADAAEGQAWIKVPENELRIRMGGQFRVVAMPIPSLIHPLIEIDEYMGFVGFMMLAIVIAFQLPVGMVVLGWTKLIDPARLAYSRKFVVFACVIAAALLTPTGDPFNLTLMAVPLWLLFEIGLLGMRLAYRRKTPPPEPDPDAF
ncbi:MAG: twin-arginine translocase subunit TatC [Planctomycetes bacterium]|nr:twin-arginine translocase subunit TatC [Planctomycetota bacterium]